MGLIAIEGLQFYAHHGYYKEEQVLGGKYTVDIYLRANISEAAATDDLSKTVNYEQIYTLVKEEMQIHSKLIEQVCQRILSRIREVHPELESLRVRVSKHNPPMKGSVERVYVELEM